MRWAVRARLDAGVFSETVPVTDERKIPSLVQRVVVAVPTGQTIFVVITVCPNVEAVAAHRTADALTRLVLVRVPSVRKVSDRGTAEGDARERVVGVVGSGFTHAIIVGRTFQASTVIINSGVNRDAVAYDGFELATVGVGPLGECAIGIGKTDQPSDVIVIAGGRVSLTIDRERFGCLATSVIVRVGDRVAVTATGGGELPRGIVVGERVRIG